MKWVFAGLILGTLGLLGWLVYEVRHAMDELDRLP